MGRVIAIANQKGGVAKTTTALNLGAALAERGRRVLLMDLDQQGSLTISAGFDPEALTAMVYTLLSAHAAPRRKVLPSLASVVMPTDPPGLNLAPASIDLAALDLELRTASPLGARLHVALH